MMETYSYLCIDLKSFYASVECVERGLDPMTANLAVADPGLPIQLFVQNTDTILCVFGCEIQSRLCKIQVGSDSCCRRHPCCFPDTMADIKSYRPKSNSLSSGQMLLRDYSFEECRLLLKEMVDALCLVFPGYPP